MIFARFLMLSFASLILFGSIAAAAEYTCTVSVNYKWRKNEEEELSVYWSSFERTAETEEASKDLLDLQAFEAKRKALSECQQIHENLAGCMSTKFSSAASVIRTLGFGARKELETAIAEDCKNSQGSCLEAFLSEPKCVEARSEDEESEGDDEDEGKEKDKKKKK